MPSTASIMIVNRQRRVPVALQPLRNFCETVRHELRFPPDSVTVQFVSDQAMARLNRVFRNKRGSTDVLSFPFSNASHSKSDEYM